MFDLNGNVSEFVATFVKQQNGRPTAEAFGGSYSFDRKDDGCNAGTQLELSLAVPSVGFRCCAAVSP